jgi:hypothetical protein
VTALLDAPAGAPTSPARRPPRGARLALAALLTGALALFVIAAVAAAPGLVRIAPVALSFSGQAPQVTLPTYGVQGMHVVGYEHGATTTLSLPVHNTGRLPMTVTSVDLGGGLKPLLDVRDVRGLPLTVAPGATGTVEVTAELANCKFFHEREVQNYPTVQLGFSVLGRPSTRAVPYDRPLMVHSPMIVGCPDRLLDRQGNDRSDLFRSG